MNNKAIFVIIIIFLIIFVVKIYSVKNLDHFSSDEAIQNLASLYNKDKLTIGNITTTEDVTVVGKANLNDTTTNLIKTNKLQLGDKWLFSAVGDASANDDWLRLYKTDGSAAYYGGLAAGKLWTADSTINGRNIFAELDDLRNNTVRKNTLYTMKVDEGGHPEHRWGTVGISHGGNIQGFYMGAQPLYGGRFKFE